MKITFAFVLNIALLVTFAYYAIDAFGHNDFDLLMATGGFLCIVRVMMLDVRIERQQQNLPIHHHLDTDSPLDQLNLPNQ